MVGSLKKNLRTYGKMRISFFYPFTIHYCVKDSSGWDIMDHCERSLGCMQIISFPM